MDVCVFTCFHLNTPDAINMLKECYASLRHQSRQPDRWVILLNGEARALADIDFLGNVEPWVDIFSIDLKNIGALKKEACLLAAINSDDILVELDYDDLLTDDALASIEAAFKASDNIKFVYSDFCEERQDGTFNLYDSRYGWRHYAADVSLLGKNKNVLVNEAFPATAHYLRRIEWAPNHVRAWRYGAYREVGMHDENLEMGDDHDLICRFYLRYGESGFFHIRACLYYYRYHNGNTWTQKENTNKIKHQVDANYIKYSESMFMRWARDSGYACLDLGSGANAPNGYYSHDIDPIYRTDYVFDLNKPWPLANNLIGVLRAYHVIEHLDDLTHFFNEAYRVLAPGGFLLLEYPRAPGLGAFGDPTHRQFINELTMHYYTNSRFSRFLGSAYEGRFQLIWLNRYHWDLQGLEPFEVVSANMIAFKGYYEKEYCGENLFDVN
jgi:SAM-dependent methyltransferase